MKKLYLFSLLLFSGACAWGADQTVSRSESLPAEVFICLKEKYCPPKKDGVGKRDFKKPEKPHRVLNRDQGKPKAGSRPKRAHPKAAPKYSRRPSRQNGGHPFKLEHIGTPQPHGWTPAQVPDGAAVQIGVLGRMIVVRAAPPGDQQALPAGSDEPAT